MSELLQGTSMFMLRYQLISEDFYEKYVIISMSH